MAKFKLARFEQARLLKSHEPGVCVALCDFWMKSFLTKPKVEPQHRMVFLASSIDEARAHQAAYGALRDEHGPEDARAQVGGSLGLGYEAQTAVVKLYVGQSGMLGKLAGDLKAIGAAATWSMRFPEGGHAIAGVHRLESVTSNMHRSVFHVFDPNIGEYVGPQDCLGDILNDLFTRIPDYAQTLYVRRTLAMKV